MPLPILCRRSLAFSAIGLLLALSPATSSAQRTERPPLHGSHWVAVTGKPLGATSAQ